jgi:hypothetical protein
MGEGPPSHPYFLLSAVLAIVWGRLYVATQDLRRRVTREPRSAGLRRA